VIKIAVTLGVLLTVVAYTVWLERKVVGRMQNRWGPSRVGPFGLLQPLAEGRPDAALRGEAHLSSRTGAVAHHGAYLDCYGPHRTHHSPVRHQHSDADHGSDRCLGSGQRYQRRHSHHPWHYLARRLWHSAGRMVIEQ